MLKLSGDSTLFQFYRLDIDDADDFPNNVACTTVFRKLKKLQRKLHQFDFTELKTLHHPAVVAFVSLYRSLSFSLIQSPGNWHEVGPL